MSSETRKKKVQETKQNASKRYYSSSKPAHWKNPPRKKNTPTQLSLHLIQAGGPCRHTGLPNYSQLEYEL